MEFLDIIIFSAVVLVIFGWKSTKETIVPTYFTERKNAHLKYYRTYGLDVLRGEDIIKELKRRGVKNVPEFTAGCDRYDVLATLEALLDTTGYVGEGITAQPEDVGLVNTKREEIWQEFPSKDDDTM